MFSENDRISQRQMKRQIVLVLLCPAFWQLAAYGASDGLPGMAGIFVGYGLLAVWCTLSSCALAGFTAAWKA